MNETALRQIFGLLTGNRDETDELFPASPLTPLHPPVYLKGHIRAGYTKSHGQPRNKAKARMAKESRRRNRQKR